MRFHLIPAAVLLAGLACVGTGAAVAYNDDPVVHASSPEQPQPSGGLGDARSSLRQANLPLSFLNNGVEQLTDGSRQLDDGAHQLADGLTQAREGGGQLSAGLDQLDGGVDQLGDGAAQISGGVDEVVDRLNTFAGMQGTITARLSTLADTLGSQPGPVTQGAAGDLRALVDTVNKEGLGPQTMARLDQLQGGARQLSYELNDPNAQFVAGMTQAAGGAQQLYDGLVLLDDGGQALIDGTGQLTEGVEPVGNMVSGISDNVKAATGALSSTSTSAAPASPPAAPTVDERAWWPYALIALGAVLIAVPGVRAAVVSRPAPRHGG
ncbi:hypothetical protein [Tomitella fengzijianii]|uniref:X-X-X-Leu-X-X-Gly heptad repeat-containing protein n=1 Tax=Tomitella fengzijianii TaxID=2597660 RepID=A0A516WYZ1_9ACTN|nr:hypothetical protein [Tomitella fengzijianii]QDQ96042.1 hypothetical protein FO059_00180 [Tomitella fengzijianii]